MLGGLDFLSERAFTGQDGVECRQRGTAPLCADVGTAGHSHQVSPPACLGVSGCSGPMQTEGHV